MNSDIQKLPVLALRHLVLFPGVAAPVSVGRDTSLAAIHAALETESSVFAVLQSEDHEDVAPEYLHTVGTIARIAQVEQDGNVLKLILQGEQRGIAVRYVQNDGDDDSDDPAYLEATVRPADEILPLDEKDTLLQALEREVRERAVELGQRAGIPGGAIRHALRNVDGLGKLADLVASYVDIPAAGKQQLLEILSVEERMRRLLVHVQRQLTVMEAQHDIQSKVQAELGDRQREMALREQMRAIQEELGETDGQELEDLRKKLEKLELPEAVRKEIDRELGRLTGMNRESMEYQVLRTYLETVAELPWGQRSDEQLDIAEAARILDEDHYGLSDVKDRVLEFLAVMQLKKNKQKTKQTDTTADADDATDSATDSATEKDVNRAAKGPILLFTGPPGVGKTSIARSIARAMGREYVRVSLGGARDEADIRGHRRTYVGALPGRIIQGMRLAGTMNPVFLLDEVDKLGASFQGDPASALLEVLDPAQNDTFVDHYLGVPFDLSEVLFVATSNFVQAIPGPLLDRMEVVEFSGYTEAEKLEIGKRYLLPRQLDENGLTAEELEVTDDALARVITYYTRESGVRQLEKQLGKLGRKVARVIAGGEAGATRIEADQVSEHLGKPRLHPERAAAEDRVGTATGMYYTPVGGDIMFVEVSTMPGKGELVLTGQLGDVMKESARAAWSYARSHAADLLIDAEMFQRDVHVHVPAGAIPKDGPSAGVSMATALVSALSGVAARHDVAMTGEITLSGRVLPIGGVKEKVLGAVRAGIRTVILPKENAPDLDDLPESVREDLEILLVDQLDEVLEHALRGGVFRSGEVFRV